MTVLTSVFGRVDREQKCDSFDMSELTSFEGVDGVPRQEGGTGGQTTFQLRQVPQS